MRWALSNVKLYEFSCDMFKLNIGILEMIINLNGHSWRMSSVPPFWFNRQEWILAIPANSGHTLHPCGARLEGNPDMEGPSGPALVNVLYEMLFLSEMLFCLLKCLVFWNVFCFLTCCLAFRNVLFPEMWLCFLKCCFVPQINEFCAPILVWHRHVQTIP